MQVALTWASNWLSHDAVWQWLTEGAGDQAAALRRTLWKGGQEGLVLVLTDHGERRWVPRSEEMEWEGGVGMQR